jgi:glycosyltransferase involved in cell wall biosynthesis
MRVLWLIDSLDIGGTERYLARVAPLMAGHGIDLQICSIDPSGPIAAELAASGLPVLGTSFRAELKRAGLPRLGLGAVRSLGELGRLIRNGRYDVVHTYLFVADVMGAVAARLGGCRRVIASRRALHAWRHPPGPLAHLLELGSNILADEMVANSRHVLEDAEHHERFLPRHRTVIYNGVDPPDCHAHPGTRAGPLRLLTVGALAPRKGQEYAIRALRLALDSGLDVQLDLVGAGPDEGMLKRLAKREGLGDHVHFLGEQRSPGPHLAAADLLLLPSRQEGFSNALLEAMAAGLPVVATDVGGNSEALDPKGGRLVPAEDAEGLAQAVLSLAEDRRRLATMGAYNRRRAARLFSTEASARELARWYLQGPDPNPRADR